MNVETRHLDRPCANPSCGGYNYYEDETGFYVCADCNTISEIRCGDELDYAFPIRTTKSKLKKDDDEEILSDDGAMGENIDQDLFSQKISFDGETMFNISTTNVKTSRLDTSSINDISSLYSRSTKKKAIIQKKTHIQILIEAQNCFENIINVLIDDFFGNKNNKINKLNHNYFNNIINFDEKEKNYFFENARKIWIYFLAKKYKSIENPVYRRKKLVRSRRNSIDKNREKENENEPNNKNKIIGKMNKKLKKIKPKEKRLLELTKMRRIMERNVYNLYNENKFSTNISFGEYKYNNINKGNNNVNKNNFYNESNFSADKKRKNILKKFIDEYDQVINFIKKDKCFDIVFETEEEKEKINITNAIEYEQLIRVCEELGISTKNENNFLINNKSVKEEDEIKSFEELIHLIFTKQQLNYKTVHIIDDENNKITNGINSNHFLFLIYEIFNFNKIPLLISDILFNYKSFFYANKLSIEEVNFLFLLNFKKFKAHVNWSDNRLDENNLLKKAEGIIDKICIHILKMPQIFNFLCKYIFKRLHVNEKIKLILTTSSKYIVEYICISIIFFCLKIVYGLNDLPYMSLLINNINKGYFNYDNDIDLKEHLKTFEKNTKNDKNCQIYKDFPSELDIIKTLIKEIKNRNNNSLLIEKDQRKLNYSQEFKKKYIDINLINLYNKIYDDSIQDINDLEKKFLKNNKNKINSDIKDKNKNKKIWKILKTKQFDKKIDNIENPIKRFNPFIEEEFNFHESVYKNKETNVEFPLPFDTYIRMKKHSQKILSNYHRPSEMMFMYLFSEFFKIDYLSLRTLTRLVEYYLEKIYVN